MTPKVYAEALKELFDLWFEDIQKGTMVSIREFDNWLSMLKGMPPEACSQTGRCSMQNIIEADGGVYPCDFYVLDHCRVANVQDENFQFFQGILPEMEFFVQGQKRGENCRACKWFPLCRGGCRRNYTQEQVNYFCESYKEFFSYAISRLEWLASHL